MDDNKKAILRHDIQAAMVNYSALRQEIHLSLQELMKLLESATEAHLQMALGSEVTGPYADDALQADIMDIFQNDIDECLPMLHSSARKLTTLLSNFVEGDPSSRCESPVSYDDVTLGESASRSH